MLAQLSYTSADYVDDSGAQSGWHIRQRSPQMSEDIENEIFRQIRPTFAPVNPLPGYATEEQIRAAEMRLSQTATGTGAVLVNCVQAGNDTTGRPNTFSHALHVPASMHSDFLGVSMWRSPHWLMPLGAQAVSTATFDADATLTTNPDIDYEAFVMWCEEPQHRAFLIHLIDTLSVTWQPREGGPSTLVAVAVDSCDEASQWVNAVSRLMAPARAWQLSWSLWERIAHQSTFESLQRASFDLIFFPRADKKVIGARVEHVIILDSAEVPPEPPTSVWARFVAAALRDQDTMDDIFDDLNAIRFGAGDASRPEWMLALAEAAAPGIITDADPSLIEATTALLLPTAKHVLDEVPAVCQIITGHMTDNSDAPFEFWHQVLAGVDTQAVLTPVLSSVVFSYLRLGSQTSHVTDGKPLNATARRLVNETLSTPEGQALIPQLLYSVGDVAQSDRTDEVDLIALLWLEREGFTTWDLPDIREALHRIAYGVLSGSLTRSDLLQAASEAPTLADSLYACVEEYLSSAPHKTIGRMLRPTCEPLFAAHISPQYPWLTANVAFKAWQTQPTTSTGTSLLAAVLGLPGYWQLPQGVDEKLAPLATLDMLTTATVEVVSAIPRCVAQALMSAHASGADYRHVDTIARRLAIPEPIYQADAQHTFGSVISGTSSSVVTPQRSMRWDRYSALRVALRIGEHSAHLSAMYHPFLFTQTEEGHLAQVAADLREWENEAKLAPYKCAEATQFLARRLALALLMAMRAFNTVSIETDSRLIRDALKWCIESDPPTVVTYLTARHRGPGVKSSALPLVTGFFAHAAAETNPLSSQGARGSALNLLKIGSRDDITRGGTLREALMNCAQDMRGLFGEVWTESLAQLSAHEVDEALASANTGTSTGDYLVKLARPESGTRRGFLGFGKGE